MIGIDSDAIIDYLKGKENIVKLVDNNVEELVTTELNIFEVFFGVYRNKNLKENELRAVKSFFSAIEVIPFKEGQKAARILADLYSHGEALDQNDVLIATTLISRGCNKIISKNIKHFSKIKGLEILSY